MLKRKIELLHNSSDRMVKALGLDHDNSFWRFMRRESWIHLKRSLELLWAVLWKRD